MKRKAIKIKESVDKQRAIYIDQTNYELIYNYLTQDPRHIDKFRFISSIILEGLRNTEVYDKEGFDTQTKGVTAMKFFKGQENDRIYCKEYSHRGKTFIVVICEFLKKKKTTRLTEREKNIIKKVASYDYEF